MGRALGYDAVAMEGEYENLPEVLLPMLVALREAERGSLRGAATPSTDAHVTVGDPLSGRGLGLAAGAVRGGLDGERRAADAGRGGTPLLAAAAGRSARPPAASPPRGRVGAALLAEGRDAPRRGPRCSASRRWRPHGSYPGAPGFVWLVAAACAGSLWSWLASDACGSCSYARRLAGGLPVRGSGARRSTSSSSRAPFGAHAVRRHEPRHRGGGGRARGAPRRARGGEGSLGLHLRRRVCAAAGAIVAVVAGAHRPPSLLLGAAIAGGGGAVHPPSGPRQASACSGALRRSGSHAMRVAEPRPEGVARLVAFTRTGCTACAFYHAAIKPALLATFGDAIAIDERDLGSARTGSRRSCSSSGRGRHSSSGCRPGGRRAGVCSHAVKEAAS